MKNEEPNQLNAKVEFENFKSDYFLIKLFDIVTKNKSLKIMKYNKKLQKRLNLDINSYKEYSKILSSIEIELKPADGKYGRFINILEKDKEYFKIYFDDSKEEIKRYNLEENEKVKNIKIIIKHQVKSFEHLFDWCQCISSIFFKKFKIL